MIEFQIPKIKDSLQYWYLQCGIVTGIRALRDAIVTTLPILKDINKELNRNKIISTLNWDSDFDPFVMDMIVKSILEIFGLGKPYTSTINSLKVTEFPTHQKKDPNRDRIYQFGISTGIKSLSLIVAELRAGKKIELPREEIVSQHDLSQPWSSYINREIATAVLQIARIIDEDN